MFNRLAENSFLSLILLNFSNLTICLHNGQISHCIDDVFVAINNNISFKLYQVLFFGIVHLFSPLHHWNSVPDHLFSQNYFLFKISVIFNRILFWKVCCIKKRERERERDQKEKGRKGRERGREAGRKEGKKKIREKHRLFPLWYSLIPSRARVHFFLTSYALMFSAKI